MKKHFLLFLGILTFSAAHSQTTLTMMENVVFYDGYAATVNEPTPTDVIRLRNDLNTRKIKDSEIEQIGTALTVNVTISALCDNYDRIGGVNIALVPKGSTSYDPEQVERLELGRFITPFMNKNISPTSVPYSFQVDNFARIFKAPEIVAMYDFWLELDVFGVPYAANTQVAGCSGRNDVFKGKVEFITNLPVAGWEPQTVVQPLFFKENFNDYQAGASDAIGTTSKTIYFDVEEPLYGAKLYLITSNHGANQGGEEYIRRMHYVAIDGSAALTYKPGGKSCEPYRIYNTQPNGIYGSSPKTEANWTSWNNWCPGDVIPIREIDLGNFPAGNHSFKISVPDATFQDDQGNFPISLYLQGNKTSLVGLAENENRKLEIFPNPAKNYIHAQSEQPVVKLEILSLWGSVLLTSDQAEADISELSAGTYLIRAQLANGTRLTQQFVKN